MTTEAQTNLEKLFLKAAKEPEARADFYRELIKSDLIVINHGEIPPKPDDSTEKKEMELKIQCIEVEGKPFIPVFTSLPKVENLVKENKVACIGMNAMGLFNMTKGADFFLNPGSECSKIIMKEEVAAILDGSIFESLKAVKPEDEYVISAVPKEPEAPAQKEPLKAVLKPETYPQEFAIELRNILTKNRDVKTAYYTLSHNPESKEAPYTVIGIESKGDWEETVDRLRMELRQVKCPNPPVEFIKVSGNDNPDEFLFKDIEPFYNKKFFSFF